MASSLLGYNFSSSTPLVVPDSSPAPTLDSTPDSTPYSTPDSITDSTTDSAPTSISLSNLYLPTISYP